MNHTILIVEDEKGIRETLAIFLRNQGYSVIQAINGKDALEKVTKEVHLAIVDIMMPVMNGVVTMQTLKQKPNFNTPIIALTADAVEGACEKYIQAGFNSYLAKPFTKDELKEKIDNCLNSEI